MLKQTLSATALRSDEYNAINKKILESVRRQLGLNGRIANEPGRRLSLALSDEQFPNYFLVAEATMSNQGIPGARLQLKGIGVPEGRQYHTWILEQRVQGGAGNVLFVIYRQPHHWRKHHLTLDEELRPNHVSVHAGDRLLLDHLVESARAFARGR